MAVDIFKIIRKTISEKIVFTDIKISTNEPISIKTPIGWAFVSDIFKNNPEFHENPATADVEAFIDKLCSSTWREDIHKKGALDVAKTLGGVARLRASVFLTTFETFDDEGLGTVEEKINVIIRKLPVEIPEFYDLGLPSNILRQMREKRGLWIVAGETGNGKSTTIASFLDYVNQEESRHILTLEQPIEYLITPKKCIVTQREIGVTVPDFATGLHNALRQRPDYILIGEVRDDDTFNTMLQAAESGHMILATFHTRSAADAINKMLNLGKETSYKASTIANVLEGVIIQKLVPTKDGKDLVLAYEIMIPNQEMRKTIKEADTTKLDGLLEQSSTHTDSLNITLNQCLTNLVKEDIITERQAKAASNNVEKFSV